MKIYGDVQSGNCYKIKLLASILEIDHEWIEVDILANETQTVEFLSKNPNGKIPLLELEDGRCISESNAILNYLAEGSDLSSEDVYYKAKILQWQLTLSLNLMCALKASQENRAPCFSQILLEML